MNVCCGEVVPAGFTHIHRGAGTCPTCGRWFHGLRVHWWFKHGRWALADRLTADRYLIEKEPS